MKKYLALITLLFSASSYGATCIPFNQFNPQFQDSNGVPLSGGSIEFFEAGTTTPANVYSDNACNTSLGDTITLDSNGRPASGGSPVLLFRDTTVDYKYTLKNSAGTSIETQDDLDSGLGTTISTNSVLAGSAASPVITLGDGTNNDGDTGFYHSAANELSYSAGGTRRLRLPTTGVDIRVTGTASAPSLTLQGDSNTGVFQSAADEIGFSSAATEIMKIVSTGLDVSISGSASTPGLFLEGDSDTGWYLASANRWGYASAGTRVVEIGAVGGFNVFDTEITLSDSSSTPELTLDNESTPSTEDTILWAIDFDGEDDSSNAETYLRIGGGISDNTGGTEDSFYNLYGRYAAASGTLSSFTIIDGSSRNVGFGPATLDTAYGTTAVNNTAVGADAGTAINSGANQNVAVGSSALDELVNSDYNVAIGANALGDVVTGEGNIGIGRNAGLGETGSNTLYIENSVGVALYGEIDNGNIAIGGTAPRDFGTSATNTLSLENGTAPSSGVANTVQIYSTDLSAGNTMLGIRTEGGGAVGTGTPTGNRTIAIEVDGTTYYLIASTTP